MGWRKGRVIFFLNFYCGQMAIGPIGESLRRKNRRPRRIAFNIARGFHAVVLWLLLL